MVAETIRQIRLENPGTSIEVLISDFNGRPRRHPHGRRGAAGHPQPQRRDGAAPAAAGAPPSEVGAIRRGPDRGPSGRHRDRLRRHGHEDRDHARPRREQGRDRRRDARCCARPMSTCSRSASTCARPGSTCRWCKYYTPAEFMALRRSASRWGSSTSQSGPLVRSSYHAAEQVPGRETAAAV